MARLGIILSLLCVTAVARADNDPLAMMLGRVYIKNVKLKEYLIFDPLSVDPEPKVMLWNVPRAVPPRGGAWFHLARSPNLAYVDYNLLGGVEWNYTMCVSMLQPRGEVDFHHVHGYIDDNHLAVPECRWQIVLSFDGKAYWIINKLYGGHLKGVGYKYNVDPLRRSVFLAVRDKVKEDDDHEKWEIGIVEEPNDQPKDDY